MAQIITIAQQKGGAGKTTLAVHLGVAMQQFGLHVALVDVDPQGSLSQWHRIRQTQALPDSPAFAACSGDTLAKTLDGLRAHCDFIIIDSPPHANHDAQNAISCADLVIIPMQPSPLDLWATQATLKMAKRAKATVKMVLNRVNPQARLSQKMQEEMQDMSLSLFGNRVAYASALMAGKGVSELAPHSAAAKEIEALCSEVLDYFGYDLQEVPAENVA